MLRKKEEFQELPDESTGIFQQNVLNGYLERSGS